MKQILAIVLSMVLVACISVTATLAYLTSTDSVENTFTIGNVVITLDEAPVDTDGKEIEGDRVRANTYKLLPGHDYDKDPTIHVDADSEDCWLFVEITNEIAAIEDDVTIADQMTDNDWTPIAEGSNIYYHADIAKADDDVVVFETFKVKGDVENDELADYAGKTVVIKAYAIQADGFDTAVAAWTAAGAEAQAKQ